MTARRSAGAHCPALAADPASAGKLYAVSNSVYRSAPAIFTIDATRRRR